MQNKTVVVTGGCGFIGSHLVDLLIANGFSVRIIDNLTGGHKSNIQTHLSNGNLSLYQEDILDLKTNSKIFEDVSYIFHLAGIGDIVPSIEQPDTYMNVNLQGTVKVLECARNSNIKKFVYAASSSCYGLADVPTIENHKIDPKYPYALSKYFGEQACFHWAKVYGLPVNSIRIFNAYGPRVRTTGAYGAVFGVFFKQKLSKQPFTVVGNGSQTRDFLYVTDVATAFLAAAETNFSENVYNLGANKPRSVNELVSIIGGRVVYIPKRPGEPDCTWADTTKIRKDLGWSPTVDFEDGVKKMLEDILLWEDAPLWDPDSISKATKVWFHHLGNK
jgi:UDP-glucose 4-epimerase